MKFPHKIISLLPLFILLLSSFAATAQQPGAARQKKKKKATEAAEVKETANFAPVDLLVQEQITDQTITGAVLFVGHGGKIVHQKAFGLRATNPRPEPMTVDTIFDLASLTKVVATAPSVMRLVQY